MPLFKKITLIILLLGLCLPLFSQAEVARVYEEKIEMTTYPFGDPDPVANIGRIYPYYKFDGYTNRPQKQTWNFVILENQYIKVYITPEIGGKIWGAIEKSSGRDFIYFNRVVKFRNIAMRGPWTSGGIEFNFGVIGHAPSCSTPVDYTYQKEADGSVSCTVGAMDLASRSEWRVTIRLPKDTAFFETSCFWYNPTPFNHSFYHWMNAAAEVSDDLQYIFPGSHYLSHGGKASAWPLDNRGRDLSRYGNNTFGTHKSYHVLGTHNYFFAGFWTSKDFGFGHWALHGDKPGKKIWLWALSRQGEIWKDLLADKENKQYTEIQSGAMYSQANQYSRQTPFKHAFFPPHSNYQSRELWFPIKGTGGVSSVSPAAALYIKENSDHLQINICPLQPLNEELLVKESETIVLRKQLQLKPLQAVQVKVQGVKKRDTVSVSLGRWVYSAAAQQQRTLQRPLLKPAQYNWKSAEGLFVKAEDLARQRDFNGALAALEKCLTREPFHVRALARLAELYMRRGQMPQALKYLNQALAIDTYDAAANFVYGLVNQELANNSEALAAFGWAARSLEFRSAAYNRMAMIYLKKGRLKMADTFARRSLDYNRFNLSSYQLMAVSARLQQQPEVAKTALARILELDPLSHFCRFEKIKWQANQLNKQSFLTMIKNEFPEQTLLELALFYLDGGQKDAAVEILNMAPRQPLVHLWLAYLHRQSNGEKSKRYLDLALKGSIRLNFPFRIETLPVLKWALVKKPHWKNKYYMALILWNNGRLSQAGKLLRECGLEPEEYPFYLARGKFSSQLPGIETTAVSADFIKARVLSPKDWRCWHQLGQHYLNTSQPEKALAVLQKALPGFKNNYIIRLDLAGALLAKGKFQKCLNLLKGTRVLPYEGAREGRQLYYQANILLAMQRLKQKSRVKVLYSCQQARLWPENLGVGKPYDSDERMEDFITAIVHRLRGDQRLSRQYYQQVIEYTKKHFQQSKPYHYLAVLALKQLERHKEAKELLGHWHSKFPNDKIVQRCQAHFIGNQIPTSEINADSREFFLLSKLLTSK